MKEHIKVAQSIIDEIYKYSEHIDTLDDECETFPMVFMVINGINNTIENLEEREKYKKELIEYFKEKYIKQWLQDAMKYEDEEDLDLEEETKEANQKFTKILKRVSKSYNY